MATTVATTSQRDFSAGEVDPEAKRDDSNPLVRAGARQMVNWRILNSKGLSNRPGRRALFSVVARVEEITMAPGITFFLAFAEGGALVVYDANGALVFTEGGKPWTIDTVRDVRWIDVDFNRSIYITFPGMKPRVLTWDGGSTWSAADYAETVTSGNQKRTFFYRISPLGITMQPSTSTPGAGATLTFSAGMNLTVGHIGTRMRYIGRQVLITAVASSVSATATIEETLPSSQVLGFSVDPTPIFSIGDKVLGVTTNSTGIVTAINSGAKQITVQLLGLATTSVAGRLGPNVFAFVSPEVVVGPGGSLPLVGVTALGAPQPVTIWDDEVMNTLRGWPASVFFDQNRLGFCNFPSVPRGVGWSAIGLPNDLYVDAQPDSAIFELVPQKCQVYDVVAGQEGSEFVFTNKGIRYIPISETNPLKPGSVAFKFVSTDTCANVQPRAVQDVILYFTAALNQVMALVSGGDVSRPHTTRDLSELRSHLFNHPIVIATQTSPGQFPERYIYVLNGDGTVVVGRMPTSDGQINSQGIVGWMPWQGASVRWIAALGSSVIFSSHYPVTPMVERLDSTLYLDSVIPVNAIPTALTPPVGKGPLWWFNSTTVDLMDQGTRMMGTYQVDSNGFIVPQNTGGEDLASPTLVAGIPWTATLEPFIPPVQAGQDVSQRMDPRQIVKAEVYVKNSTGLLMATLYSGQSGPNLPAQGTVMANRRVPAWDQGEDATLPPPLREQSYHDVPIGRAHDPRWAVIKDTPGPIEVLEIATRVSV